MLDVVLKSKKRLTKAVAQTLVFVFVELFLRYRSYL